MPRRPPEEFRQGAHIQTSEDYERIYRESVEDPDRFWARAAEELHWFRKWDQVLEWKHLGPNGSWEES